MIAVENKRERESDEEKKQRKRKRLKERFVLVQCTQKKDSRKKGRGPWVKISQRLHTQGGRERTRARETEFCSVRPRKKAGAAENPSVG